LVGVDGLPAVGYGAPPAVGVDGLPAVGYGAPSAVGVDGLPAVGYGALVKLNCLAIGFLLFAGVKGLYF
jgi:hypothetical protein